MTTRRAQNFFKILATKIFRNDRNNFSSPPSERQRKKRAAQARAIARDETKTDASASQIGQASAGAGPPPRARAAAARGRRTKIKNRESAQANRSNFYLSLRIKFQKAFLITICFHIASKIFFFKRSYTMRRDGTVDLPIRA